MKEAVSFSQPPTVKICGIRVQETLDALQTLPDPPEYIGFVFAASRREITPDVFSTLRFGTLKSRKVGVFVNPSLAFIDHVLDHGALDMIQLSGDASETWVKTVRERYGLPVIKTYRPEGRIPDRGLEADVILLDTSLPGQYGGTGKTFDWSHIERWRPMTLKWGKPLWVAGGIHAENVSTLLQAYVVDGIDVSSGVETHGQKDMSKIKALLEAVRKPLG